MMKNDIARDKADIALSQMQYYYNCVLKAMKAN